MPELVYINPFSAAKITAAVSLVLGLIVSIIVIILGIFSILSSFILPISTGDAGMGVLAIIIQVVITTIALAITGFLFGAIGAVIYNMAAGFFGGIYLGFAEELIVAEEKENERPIGYE